MKVIAKSIIATLFVFLSAVALADQEQQSGEKWALLIGVDRNEALGELEVCAADARALKAVLGQIGYRNINILTDDSEDLTRWPTSGNIRRAVQRISEVADEDDTILLFFSGHGIMRDGEGHIVPVDGDRRNAIALSWVKGQLAYSKARHKMLILDACHAGAAKGVEGIVPGHEVETGISMLLSSGEDQVSWPDDERGHSVFSWYLLEGLTGAAADEDGTVSFESLSEYVRDRVRAWSFSEQKELQVPQVRGIGLGGVTLARLPEGAIEMPEFERVPDTEAEPPEPEKRAPKIYTDWPFDSAEARRRQKETADALGVPVEKTIDLGGGVTMEFVLIPAGEYMRGSESGGSNEKPVHRVRITTPFYMGVTPVTQSQYKTVTGSNPSHFDGHNRPVERVSWEDAKEFCQRVSRRTERDIRLPTEAEWEYAARAGTETEFYFGDDEEKLGNYAWYNENSGVGRRFPGVIRRATHPVGRKTPNVWGLHDMHGGIIEWCADWYGEYPSGMVIDPVGPSFGEQRVFRGGSWHDYAHNCRSASRTRRVPYREHSKVGFRVAISLNL